MFTTLTDGSLDLIPVGYSSDIEIEIQLFEYYGN
jgi:hypothetical protein